MPSLPTPIVHIPGVQAVDIAGGVTPAWTGTAAYAADRYGRVAVDASAADEGPVYGAYAAMPTGSDPWAVAAWVYVDSADVGLSIIDYLDSVSGLGWSVGVSSGTMYGWLYDAAEDIYGAYSTAVGDGWHHVVFVRPAANVQVRLYVDGQINEDGYYDTAPVPALVALPDPSLAIGLYSSAGETVITSEIHVFAEALDAEQALALYLRPPQSRPIILGPGRPTPDVTDTALEGAWFTGIGGADNGRDASANGVDLVPTGGPLVEYDDTTTLDGTSQRWYGAPPATDVTGDMAIGVSFRADGWLGTDVVIANTTGSSGRAAIQIDAGNGIVSAGVYDGSDYSRADSTALDLSYWHRAWLVVRSGVAELWVDSTQYSETSVVGITGTTRLTLGSNTAGTVGQWLTGAIRDAVIYTRALTTAEIAADYARFAPDASLLIAVDPAHGDTSLYRRALTWTNAVRNLDTITLANGGVAWAAVTLTSYAYWWDEDDGTGPNHWATDGTTTWMNGVATVSAEPITIGATGISGETGTISHLRGWGAAKTAAYMLADYQRTRREK